ncbi:hypothetical protein Bhyg_07823 [Pseudolycoriella hygida]|uniref:Uncharacterized protein n=1 Tax=Pseudolycoriella hygida TaxID=35572 RepID=A0A9Q0S2D0_9DIPT|nr:hypothetical protein Bhyg_07823 [Pseudolycoriella hygida]
MNDGMYKRLLKNSLDRKSSDSGKHCPGILKVSVLAVRRVATKVAEVLHGTNLTDLNKDRYADEIVHICHLFFM